MQPVTQLKDLGESVMYFCGANLDSALASARDWAKTRKVTMQRYFQQPPFGRSKLVTIIADYS